MPTNTVRLGFVNLGEEKHPKSGKNYSIVSANSDILESIEYPRETEFHRLSLDLYEFYINKLPDGFFDTSFEGLLKVQINTRDPQNIDGSPTDATFATEFDCRENQYAPTFLFRGVFRNVLFREWINLRFDLFEMDSDASEYYDKVKSVIEGVPEIKNLDVLKGIPYLNLASQLFGSLIDTFGKNPDDHVWGEIPILELTPTPGGAFLRTGIYVIYEAKNSSEDLIDIKDLTYCDGKLKSLGGMQLSNHLIFGVSIRPHLQ